MNSNSMHILNMLVKKLQIPVTQKGIVNELQRQQDPSSLLAISDIFDNWNIAHAAYNARVGELLETEIPLPFIACFKNGEFVLVTKINKDSFIVSNDRWNNFRLEIQDFKKHYQGTILAFEKDASSGEADYPSKRRTEIVNSLRFPFIISGLTMVLILFLLANQNYIFPLKINIGLLLLFKSTGVAISILLLIKSLDANNSFVKKICGSDENQNCNAILASKTAKITDELSWSEVGFFYFAGTWLALLFNNDSGLIRILAIINLLSLPYSFYSIYYQWKIAKQWCIFCCCIQVLLWIEFLSFLPNLWSATPLINLYDCSKLLIAMLLPIILWVYIKPLLINSEKLKLLTSELYRFKYNKEHFKNIIQKELKYKLPSEENSITIGNREADNVITVVSSPFCHACADVHKVLDDLIDIRDDVKLQFVFLARIRSNEIDTKVLTHFMNLKLSYDEFGVKQALSDWYRQKDKNYELWQKDYPVNEFINDPNALVNQKLWCKMVDITGTPTLFINGRKLPDPYRPEDIKYVI